jgi:hypothetical protein
MTEVYNSFFDLSPVGQSQTTLHEGMHLIQNISDVNFAKGLNVYTDGMSGAAASAAWGNVLKENCR